MKSTHQVLKKIKQVDPFERSTLQIMSIIVRDEKEEKTNRLPFNSKTHSTVKDKKIITLYAEDIYFLVTRARWLVTHIYAHYAFEQSKFKKDFVIMNQKSRQKASTKVEKDFYKLLNNSNFGIDCRNNMDNCYLEPVYDNFSENSYLKNYTSLFSDSSLKDFFCVPLLKQEIEKTYASKLFKLDKDDPTYEARKKYLDRLKEEDLDVLSSFEKSNKKRKFKSIEEKISDNCDPRKTKMIIDFNESESASIKAFSVRKKNVIKATTRFMSSNLIMFAKLSLKSLIYDLSDIFSFPNEIVKEIYKKIK